MAESYSPAVIARFREPRFSLLRNSMASAAVGVRGARAAGALVEIHLELVPTGTVAARFLAYGGPAVIAAADWLCEQVDGLTHLDRAPSASDTMRALALTGRHTHGVALVVGAFCDAKESLLSAQ